MKDRKESFVFYRSFIDAIRTLPESDQLFLFNAIADFALDQKEPDLNGTAKGFWMLIRPNIEANNKRYENGKKGAEHGIKGGRPKKETPEKPLDNPKKTPNLKNKTPDVDVDVDVDVNVNVEKEKDDKLTRLSKIQREFYDSLRAFSSEFDKETLREFYNYWSEPTPSKTKIKYQTEKTWDTHRRLLRWVNMGFKKGEKEEKITYKPAEPVRKPDKW